MIQFFNKLFQPLMVEDDEPLAHIWAGNEGYAACINPNTGHVYATLWNDGYGKFHPTIYTSVFAMPRVQSRELVVRMTLHGFLRCAFELVRLEYYSMKDAQDAVEEILCSLDLL